MTEFFAEYGLFLAKTVTVVVAVLATVAGIIALSMRGQARQKDHLEVKHLNHRYRHLARTVAHAALTRKMLKQRLKMYKKEEKSRDREEEKTRLFVLDFHGDIRASAVASLREEVTAVLLTATPKDEVLVRLESAGGVVHSYGLAASQLLRIKDKNIKLTVAVDKVAASGGYMMACVADRVLAAPFAVLGSIGVVAQLPNFHRLLEKNDIDFEQITAGEYKRTLTLFGENTDQGRKKFREEIEDVHTLFKEFVQRWRPDLDIAQVATGEHWYGSRALELKLVDELRTSDDYLLAASEHAELIELSYTGKKPWLARLLASGAKALGLQG